MSNWATVVAMEAEGARGSSPRYVANLGYALSREHLKTKLRALQKDLVPTCDILGGEAVLSTAFDNTYQIMKKKFTTEGMSSNAMHGTCRFANTVQTPNIASEYVFLVIGGQPQSISFLDQVFPAASGTPPFELMSGMQAVDLERFLKDLAGNSITLESLPVATMNRACCLISRRKVQPTENESWRIGSSY
jgi:hypothetical protein